ncbi:methyltransferase domain-containing protein [Candidatus Collierbacteria bacterium]|nr:methyltransferase domain-containing protein [Candidatus Collierbacteria bacterium]
MANLTEDQIAKYTDYHSLDLANKIYQLKALRLAQRFSPTKPQIVELGSADDSFLNLLKKRLNGEGLGLDLTKGDDLEKPLKVKANTADLVIALEVIEHLFDTDLFLSEIHRILKPKGFLILSTPNLASLPNRFRLLFGGYPKYLEYSRSGAGHIHLYTLPTIKFQITNHKLQVVQFTSPNFLCPYITKSWFPNFLKEFCMALGDLFPSLGSHLLIVAQKKV